MKKAPVSVIIPVLNEAKNLARCLGALSWAEEVFVVDSGSSDGSAAIAEAFGAKVVQFRFNGNWPKKKNWALENLPLSYEWALILDADEVLSPEAGDEVREICEKNARGFDGYFINRRFMFMGKWLKHAYSPNWILRFFKHKLGRYEKLTAAPTESGDVEIHENILLRGSAGRLKCQIDHYAFPSVQAFVEKHNRYSNWEARMVIERSLECAEEKNWRRRLKIMARGLPFRPLLRFLYVYILEKGFLDGWEGYYFARLHGFYEFLSVCKTYELKKQRKQKNGTIVPRGEEGG